MIPVEIHALAVAILSLLPPMLIGIFLVAWIMPSDLHSNFPTKVSVGVVLGLGLDSCFYYVWSNLFSPKNLDYFAFETALLFLLAGLCYQKLIRRKNDSFWLSPKVWTWSESLPTLIFGVVLTVFALAFVAYSYQKPHAEFDAYAIWNLRARQIFSLGNDWRNSFSPLIYHADYPLMLPLNVARSWVLSGDEALRVPMVVALAFTISLPAMLFTALSKTRGYWQAVLAGIVLLCTPGLFSIGAKQVADVPLAAFILAAGLLFYRYGCTHQKEYLLLCGLSAGLGAWTKNEGLFFLGILVLAVVVWIFTHGKQWPHLLFFLAGLAFPLALVIHFKLFLAPPGDMLAGRSLIELMIPFTKIDRYATTAQYFYQYLLNFQGWKIPVVILLLVYVFVLPGRLRKDEQMNIYFLSGMVLLILLADFSIYILTPHDLVWHITHSLDRLLLQVYPLFLLCIFSQGSTVEQMK